MKRYTEAQKKKIVAKIENAPRGKTMEVIKATGVSYATVRKWMGKGPKLNVGKGQKAMTKGVVTKLFKLRSEMLRSGAKFDNLLKQL